MADKDKLVKVGQLDTVVDEIVNKFGETNGRLRTLDERVTALEAGEESEVEVFDATEF
jgi:hypothetical protein